MPRPCPLHSTVLYDAECPMCMTGGALLQKPLAARGFASSTLQSHAVESHAAMRILTPDGRTLRGAECWIHIARQLWWARPLVWLGRLPGGMNTLHFAYAFIARHRHAISQLPIWRHARRARPRSIWVEAMIPAPVDHLWQLTQTPEQHQRWDLRFSSITYLPWGPDEAQRFEYVTRIGFGLGISGAGETTGERSIAGVSTSALKFWSHHPLSLIRAGSGYWRYESAGNVTRFMTRYDYQVHFGFIGRVADRVVFRPLMAWATAWSFDRLSIWAQRGIPPEVTRTIAIAATLARAAVALTWIYAGLIPKLLVLAPDEWLLASNTFPAALVLPAIRTLGVLEIVLGMYILFFWQRRWPLWLSVALMPIAIVILSIYNPQVMLNMFSPILLNGSVAMFAAIALVLQPLAPSASRTQWGISA